MVMKAMISQPMAGKTDGEIAETRERAKAKSLENKSLCHVAYFCKGWEKARRCRIEHDAAVAYGLEVLYEG